MKNITHKLIENFRNFLISEEKSDATLEKKPQRLLKPNALPKIFLKPRL